MTAYARVYRCAVYVSELLRRVNHVAKNRIDPESLDSGNVLTVR